MGEGKYYSGGAARHIREGGSIQENMELPVANFSEQVRKMELSGDADRIAEKYEFGLAIEDLLRTHSLEDLTPAVCEDFLFKSEKFSEYHPGAVLAVAKAILKRKEANKPTTH